MAVQIARLVLATQDDISGLQRQIDVWQPNRIKKLALVYKVEGEYEDGSRERARGAVFALLSRHGLDARAEMITVVGWEGLATPFGYVMADVEGDAAKSSAKRLAIGLARGTPPQDGDLDRASFKSHVAALVRTAMADAGLEQQDVETVLINTPQPMTGDKGLRGRKARALAALAAGIALGEINEDDVTEAALLHRAELFTRRVQSFAGPTVKQIEVIVLGNRAGAGGDLMACSNVTDDLIDMRPIKRMLVNAGLGLDSDGELTNPDRVAAMIIKSGVRPDGLVSGLRTTLFAPGLPVEKHVRAAQSGLIAGLLGTSAAFNTYDPIQQCPLGGSAVCAVVRVG